MTGTAFVPISFLSVGPHHLPTPASIQIPTSKAFEDFSFAVACLDHTAHQATGRSRASSERAGKPSRRSSRIRSWRRAMIRRKQTPLSSNYSSSPDNSPRSSPRSSCTISGWEADDEGAMSADDHLPSGSTSVGSPEHERRGSDLYSSPSRPTLGEVLSNSAPHPWTLSAFTAFLSQNHCLENLEFTMDAERYRDRYDAMMARSAKTSSSPDAEECSYLRMLWQRMMDAYVIADGLREINIPSHVREALLSLPNHTAPPEPDGLEIAVKIIYDLMEESVLVSFLNEVPPPKYPEPTEALLHGSLKRRGSSKERKMKRSRSRIRASPPAGGLEMPFSLHHSSTLSRLSTTSNLTTGLIKASRAASHVSSGSGDGSLTDDSASASSPPGEPMTPPTTPPASDVGSSSPRSRGDITWKKMLVWKKKSSSGMRDDRFPTLED